MNKGKVFFNKISKPTDRDGAYYAIYHSNCGNCFRLSRDLKTGKFSKCYDFGRSIPAVKKRTTVVPQNAVQDSESSGKLLTCNRNSRIYCLDDKYPMSSSVPKIPENVVAFVIRNFRRFKPDFFIEWKVPSI